MKIRIKGNKVRYRLTQTEVQQMYTQGVVEEKTEFPHQVFHYRLEVANVNQLQAEYQANTICLKLSKKMIEEWFESDKVGFSETQNELTLLVEKDFACLDPTDEDQSDNYPNPNQNC